MTRKKPGDAPCGVPPGLFCDSFTASVRSWRRTSRRAAPSDRTRGRRSPFPASGRSSGRISAALSGKCLCEPPIKSTMRERATLSYRFKRLFYYTNDMRFCQVKMQEVPNAECAAARRTGEKNTGKQRLSGIFPYLFYSYIFSRFFCTVLR